MRSGNMDSLPFESDGVGGSTSRRGGGEGGGGGGGGGGVHSVHATPRSSRGDVPPLSARREKKDAGIGAAIEYHADSPGSGVVVEHVWPGSPAEAYGLESGDVILAVDRAPAQGVDNVKRSICGPEGTTVTLRILRNGEQVEIGPIQRGNWVTLSQLDSSLARLRRVASGKGPDAATVSEVCNNMTRLRGLLEEERVRFKGAMVQMKQKHTVAVKQSMVLGKAVVEVSEELQRSEARAAILEKRIGQVLQMLESAKTGEVRRRSMEHGASWRSTRAPQAYNEQGELVDAQEGAQAEGGIINERVGALLSAIEKHTQQSAVKGGEASTKGTFGGFLMPKRGGKGGGDDAGAENEQSIGWMCSELRLALEHEAEQHRSRRQANRAEIDAEKERLITELSSARAELSKVDQVETWPKQQRSASLMPSSRPNVGVTMIESTGTWKVCKVGFETFYYSTDTGQVRFTVPWEAEANVEGERSGARTARSEGVQATTYTDLSFTEGGSEHASPHIHSMAKRSRDVLLWNGARIPGRRASFGRVCFIEGPVKRAIPYMGDTELAESMHGCIAVMGRGVCTFTEKAERAARAGAAGVVFVNHEDRLFDVIGDAPHINIPVIAVARVGADNIPDGAIVAFSFDESWGGGGGLVSPPLHHIAIAKADISPSLACDSRAIASSESMLAFHAKSKPVVWRGKGGDHGSLKGGDHGGLPAWPSSNLPHTHSTGSSPTLMMTDTGSTVASQAGTDVPPYSIQFKTAPVAPGAVRKDAGDAQKTVGSWKEEVARGNKSQKWILVRRAIDAVGDIWLPEGWKMRMSRSYNRVFYYNIHTGLRRWTRPPVIASSPLSPHRVSTSPSYPMHTLLAAPGEGQALATTGGHQVLAATGDGGWAATGDGMARTPRDSVATQRGDVSVQHVGSSGGSVAMTAHNSLMSPVPPVHRGGTSNSQTPRVSQTESSQPSRSSSKKGRWSILNPVTPRGPAVDRPPASPTSPRQSGTNLSPRKNLHLHVSEAGHQAGGGGVVKQSPSQRGGKALPKSPRSPEPSLIPERIGSPQLLSMRELETLPIWPEEAMPALGSMARIVVGNRQIICARAEFGRQSQPVKGSAAVRGLLQRCEPWLADRDFEDGQLSGRVALIGRGGCRFTEKAERAQRAGAVAVVIVNHADVLFNVLGKDSDINIPVVSVTKSDAENLEDGAMASVIWGLTRANIC